VTSPDAPKLPLSGDLSDVYPMLIDTNDNVACQPALLDNAWEDYLKWDNTESWGSYFDLNPQAPVAIPQVSDVPWDWSNTPLERNQWPVVGQNFVGTDLSSALANDLSSIDSNFDSFLGSTVGSGSGPGSSSAALPVPQLSPAPTHSPILALQAQPLNAVTAPLQPPAEPFNVFTNSQADSSRRSSSYLKVNATKPAESSKKRPPTIGDSTKGDVDSSKPIKRSKKKAHNAVEKRYRENLNSKMTELRDSIPTLRGMKSSNLSDEDENGSGATPSRNLKKAHVLTEATDYIRQLERNAAQLREENENLKRRMAFLRTLAGPESPGVALQLNQPPTPQGPASSQIYKRARKSSKPSTTRPHTVDRPSRSRSPKRDLMSKVLMGSLAGLTVFEGINDHGHSGNSHASRGLFAFPFEMLQYLMQTRSTLHAPGVGSFNFSLLTMIRITLVLSAFMSVLSSSWFEWKPKSPEDKKPPPTQFFAPPSLAAPLEVRQKAWSTSIQTVWVPKRNVILELSALALKTLKIFLREMIGWEGYARLTGVTKEDEEARIRAWDLAIDSQLLGGDPEVCLDRLALTFLASVTLPNSPSRFALKALHVHVLFRGLERYKFLRLFGVQAVASRLAAYFWNRAKDPKLTFRASLTSENSAGLNIPSKSLSLLLQQDCEDVFLDDIKQNAYDIAWNKLTTEGIAFEDEGMDIVVKDSAIFSPLDVLAACWSSKILQQALLHLIRVASGQCDDYSSRLSKDLDLVMQAAPPGSGSQLRGLVAVAALQDRDRDANITAVIQKMNIQPRSKSESDLKVSTLNLTAASAQSPDVRVALRCAMLNAALENNQSTQSPAALQPLQLLTSLRDIMEKKEIGLLGFTAAYKSLRRLCADEDIFNTLREEIEQLAGLLRIYIGGESGRLRGLDYATTASCVQYCLDICKKASGLEPEAEDDQGYWSQNELTEVREGTE
jgi:hypothetical protein